MTETRVRTSFLEARRPGLEPRDLIASGACNRRVETKKVARASLLRVPPSDGAQWRLVLYVKRF